MSSTQGAGAAQPGDGEVFHWNRANAAGGDECGGRAARGGDEVAGVEDRPRRALLEAELAQMVMSRAANLCICGTCESVRLGGKHGT